MINEIKSVEEIFADLKSGYEFARKRMLNIG
jgi:hypothetical protein